MDFISELTGKPLTGCGSHPTMTKREYFGYPADSSHGGSTSRIRFTNVNFRQSSLLI
jgi:hypothetical protein